MVRNIFTVCTIVAALLTITVNAAQPKAPKPLAGWVVVIDPGHGGADPGSNGIFAGNPTYESSYTYDVALRVKHMVTKEGGMAFMTIVDGDKENNAPAQQLFPPNRSAVFALDRSKVVAMTAGLSKRLAYGNMLNSKYPKAKRAWISLHFDKLGTNTEIQGVRIIAPDAGLRLAKSLEESFGDAHRLRAKNPVVASGDARFGLRRLYILSTRNSIQQRVLIELGNFNNTQDMWRIRAANVRDAWAQAIVRSLVQF